MHVANLWPVSIKIFSDMQSLNTFTSFAPLLKSRGYENQIEQKRKEDMGYKNWRIRSRRMTRGIPKTMIKRCQDTSLVSHVEGKCSRLKDYKPRHQHVEGFNHQDACGHFPVFLA
jgi:hypothetical protein